jgi:N-acetylmuramoyl-L-alanine amidase
VIVKDPKTGKKRKKLYKNKKGKLVPVETINPEPFGTETYVMGLKNEAGKMRVATRENSAIFLEDDYEKKYGGFDPESEESYIIMSNYTSAYVIQSANLAVKIQDEYTKKAGRIDKGVHRQSIWVLWRTAMPSILTEIGYLTNPLEETFLGSDVGQEYLAKALFRGVRKYKDEVDGTKKEYTDAFENQPALENENIKAGNQPYVRKNEEEDLEEEEKKPMESTLTKTITETSTKVEDGKSITIVSIDSAEKIIKPIDTVVTALKIAEKFKADKKTSGDVKNPLNTKEVKAPDVVKETENKEGVFFKVQFASSEVVLDLKQEKYKVLSQPEYYKVGTTLKYTSGNFSKFKTAQIHQSILREKGFTDCFVIAFKNGSRIDLNEARKLSPP